MQNYKKKIYIMWFSSKCRFYRSWLRVGDESSERIFGKVWQHHLCHQSPSLPLEHSHSTRWLPAARTRSRVAYWWRLVSATSPCSRSTRARILPNIRHPMKPSSLFSMARSRSLLAVCPLRRQPGRWSTCRAIWTKSSATRFWPWRRSRACGDDMSIWST